MKNIAQNRKTISFLVLVLSFYCATAQTRNDEAKMNAFVTNLMSKMTLDEKIGQLNLVTAGGQSKTGSVVNEGVEGKIKNGAIGGIFGIWGTNYIGKAQDIAVKN